MKIQPNKITQTGNVTHLSLRNNANECVGQAIVNSHLYNKVKNSRWYLMKAGYVASRSNGKHCFLHHVFLPKKTGLDVDHIDGNPLNNVVENLRYLTRAENNVNSAKRAGVGWIKKDRKWRARIKVKGKEILLGRFASREDAVKARERGLKKYYPNIRREL